MLIIIYFSLMTTPFYFIFRTFFRKSKTLEIFNILNAFTIILLNSSQRQQVNKAIAYITFNILSIKV